MLLEKWDQKTCLMQGCHKPSICNQKKKKSNVCKAQYNEACLHFLIQAGRACVCCQAENELRNWTHEIPEPAPYDECLGTQYCRSRLPDKWPPNGLVTRIPRCWFPALSLCIQVLVCTFLSFNAHPLAPGSPMPAASVPLPKTSNSVLISELGLEERPGCLHRKDRESVSPVGAGTRWGGGGGVGRKDRGSVSTVGAGGSGEKVQGISGLQPHFTYTSWLLNSLGLGQEEAQLACLSPCVPITDPIPLLLVLEVMLPLSHSPRGRKQQVREGLTQGSCSRRKAGRGMPREVRPQRRPKP